MEMLSDLQLPESNLQKLYNVMNERGPRATIIIQVIGTLITVGFVIFGGGALYQRVIANEYRLNKIEAYGAPPLAAHVAQDEERDKSINERVRRVEEAIGDIQELKADVREIKTDLKNLQRK